MKRIPSFRPTHLLTLAVVLLAVLNLALMGVVWTRLGAGPSGPNDPTGSTELTQTTPQTLAPHLERRFSELRRYLESGEWSPERRQAVLERLRLLEQQMGARGDGSTGGFPPGGGFNRLGGGPGELSGPGGPGGPGRMGPPDGAGLADRGLVRRLGLDSLQLERLRELRVAHMANVRAQEAKIRAARRDLLADRLTQRPEDGDVATLGADSPSAITSSTSTSIEARFDSLAADLIRLERLNLAHLEDIRNLLDETQRREYDRGIVRLFSDSDSNGGAGPQPGPRSGGRAERPRFAN